MATPGQRSAVYAHLPVREIVIMLPASVGVINYEQFGIMGARRGVEVQTFAPLPLENVSMRGYFCYLFPYGGPFSSCGGLFCPYGGLFWAYPPPQKMKFCGHPCSVFQLLAIPLFIALLVSSHYRIGPTLLNKIIVDKVDNDIYYISYCCFCMRRFFLQNISKRQKTTIYKLLLFDLFLICRKLKFFIVMLLMELYLVYSSVF